MAGLPSGRALVLLVMAASARACPRIWPPVAPDACPPRGLDGAPVGPQTFPSGSGITHIDGDE